MRIRFSIMAVVLALAYAATLIAQGAPAPQGGRGAGAAPAPQGGRGGGAPAYPVRPPGDPAAIARGQQIYSTNCSFCHGSDTRGGETGPNLPRSQLVLNDRNGELIGPVVQNGRPQQGMPPFTLSGQNIADLVEFIHSVPVNLRGAGPSPALNVVVGNASAGEAYFKTKCATCHSVSGDLRGIASRVTDPRNLQNFWVSGGGGGGRGAAPNPNSKPITVVVTPASGPRVEGRLERIDDFVVTLIDAAGDRRTFRRDSETLPRVEVRNPRQPHIDMFSTLNDADIHNVTAYLVTVK